MKRVVVATVLWFCSGCGGGVEQISSTFTDAVPADLSALTLEITADASESSALVSEEGVQRQAHTGGVHPEFLHHTREKIKSLNDAVKKFVAPIKEIAAANTGTVKAGDVVVYTPLEKNGVSYRLTLKRVADKKFGWKLEVKKSADADTAYKVFAAGALTSSDVKGRGRGTLGLDLDILKAVDTSVVGAGKLFGSYTHVGGAKVLVYAAKEFSPDAANVARVSGTFNGYRLANAGVAGIRAVGFVNLPDVSASPTPEFVRYRVRWRPGLGGRADILATGGDIEVGKVVIGFGCWDAAEEEGYFVVKKCALNQQTKQVGACDQQVLRSTGSPQACTPLLGAVEPQPPPVDEHSTTIEEGGPEAEVAAPPAVVPDGSGA